jgi:hypothetical protein
MAMLTHRTDVALLLAGVKLSVRRQYQHDGAPRDLVDLG